MAKTITIALFLFALLAGCGKTPSSLDWSDTTLERANHAFEDGLRVGHADGKAGSCDHPFPYTETWPGYGSLYLGRFETGYYKGCAIARKSKPAPRKSPPRKAPPVLPRCEAF